MTGQNEPTNQEHAKKYHFFLDGRKVDTDKSSVTGAEIKQLGGATMTYQLFQEEEGDDPDKPISDLDSVNLEKGSRHYYAVPPATFGAV